MRHDRVNAAIVRDVGGVEVAIEILRHGTPCGRDEACISLASLLSGPRSQSKCVSIGGMTTMSEHLNRALARQGGPNEDSVVYALNAIAAGASRSIPAQDQAAGALTSVVACVRVGGRVGIAACSALEALCW